MVETTVMDAPPEFHAALLECMPHLRAFARSLTRNGDRADDLVHDATIRALAAAHQFAMGSNFKAWIFTILRNCHYNEIRKHHWRNVPFDQAPEERQSTGATQEAALEFCDFRRAFSQLGVSHREVLMLVGASGLSYEEVANVCNCAVGTVKSRVSRAREELTRLLSDNTLIRRSEFAPVAQSVLFHSAPAPQSVRQRSDARERRFG
ncbi:MAG TPA: sigma-70 family RNA polymerase sigma factor [Verrucomicrobiae bacterium]|nr:sigma-70 family RNA polymerase sigma factor [Verrucomicrobiae bacterium]